VIQREHIISLLQPVSFNKHVPKDVKKKANFDAKDISIEGFVIRDLLEFRVEYLSSAEI